VNFGGGGGGQEGGKGGVWCRMGAVLANAFRACVVFGECMSLIDPHVLHVPCVMSQPLLPNFQGSGPVCAGAGGHLPIYTCNSGPCCRGKWL
jgi:hypothetical protein